MWIDDAEEGALSNKYVRQNVPDSKKQSYVEGLMMQKIVRYHAHIKNKQTARNYSLLIFLRF